jgi:hypothetical protein
VISAGNCWVLLLVSLGVRTLRHFVKRNGCQIRTLAAGSSRFRWDINSGHPSLPGHSIPDFIAIATPAIHRCSTSPKGPNTCGQWRSVTLGQSSRIQQAQRPGQNHLHDQKLWSAASCALSRNWTQNPWLPKLSGYPVRTSNSPVTNLWGPSCSHPIRCCWGLRQVIWSLKVSGLV